MCAYLLIMLIVAFQPNSFSCRSNTDADSLCTYCLHMFSLHLACEHFRSQYRYCTSWGHVQVVYATAVCRLYELWFVLHEDCTFAESHSAAAYNYSVKLCFTTNVLVDVQQQFERTRES